MSDSLEALIKQAEAQKIQIEMNLFFEKNIKLFKKYQPTLCKQLNLENHSPTLVVPYIDPNGQLNLINKQEQAYFYNDIPTDYCSHQVEGFKTVQRVSKFTINQNKEYNARHIHIPHLNNLLKQYKCYQSPTAEYAKEFITNLVITGIGLGYHIPALMKNYNIQNIFIYENCIDTFFASLHAIDWEPIFNYFLSERRSISFSIAESPTDALQRIENNLHNIGFHNHIFSFIYPHTERSCEKEFVEAYITSMQSYIGGLGYFDDEQIGLAHAYHNLNTNIPMFTARKTYNRKTRILIIGNGPSLDKHKEYLLENHDKMVLMTCGTALGPVLKMGIKPDFHVEMERTNTITDFLTYNISDEDRQDITLLCLHTVSPNAIRLFDEVFCAIKPSDAGTSMVETYFSPERPTPLYFCNPTVTNCGLALAASMGFLDVHLIGIDLGFIDDGDHHSKNSIHFELEKNANKKNQFKYGYSDRATLEVEANFGGKIKTHPILNSSRISFERLLKLTTAVFSGFRCYNSNSGAKIAHTISIDLSEIPAPKETLKEKEIATIKSECFIRKNNQEFKRKTPEEFLKYFFSIEKTFRINGNINNDEELIREFQRLYNMISCAKDPITHRLIKGSTNTFFGAIIEHSLYRKNPDDFRRNVDIGTKAFNQFMDNVYQIMKEDPFRLDDTCDPIFKDLNK